jgi:hypothetical protein
MHLAMINPMAHGLTHGAVPTGASRDPGPSADQWAKRSVTSGHPSRRLRVSECAAARVCAWWNLRTA